MWFVCSLHLDPWKENRQEQSYIQAQLLQAVSRKETFMSVNYWDLGIITLV